MSTGRQPTEDRSQCTPCRGTGRVVSAKGGGRHEVTCPWCGGSGRFQPGRDAQAEAAASRRGQAGGTDAGEGDDGGTRAS